MILRQYTRSTITLLLIIVSCFCSVQAQTQAYQKFESNSLLLKKDTINYHIFSPQKINDNTGIILFLHGSGPFPMYHVKKEGDALWINSTMPFDLEGIPKDYALVLVSKKCVPFLVTAKAYDVNTCFYEYESLDYRVWQCNEVLNHILKKVIKNPKKVIAIGHSEGSDVVAKLGTVNKRITHIGFWSGSGNTQYNDFALMISKEMNEGKIDGKTGIAKLDSLYAQLTDIENNPASTDKFWLDNTYKRWHEFSEPAVNNLLKINIPVFVAIGTKDQAVPLESSLVIKTEFIRHHKNNLNFRIYPDLDHSFETVPGNENEEPRDMWMAVFKEFMEWVQEQ